MFTKAEKDMRETTKSQEKTSLVETTTQNVKGSSEVKAVIGPSITIKGELVGEEDIVLQGRVVGTITLKQNSLTVSKQGSIKADVNAEKVTVEGKVEGDIHGEESVLVRASGNVQGNIVAPRVSLEEGAKFKGSIDMEPKKYETNRGPVKQMEKPKPESQFNKDDTNKGKHKHNVSRPNVVNA